SLRYFHTAMTDPGPGMPWFVDVGYVDGEIFVHYDSTTRKYAPRTKWMAANVEQQYWDELTRIAQRSEQTDCMNLNRL
ncbi:HA1F protein, partial [Odontophorus gujanensis]|nr:HA1F protein [Odontophorus gujanensis]